MNNIIRNLIYQGKNMYRDKSFLFWSVLYPLIMAVFFYTAFSGLMNIELENINVGLNRDNPLKAILSEIDFISTVDIEEADIKSSLENEEIDGYIDDDLNLLVSKSGLNQTVIKEVLDQIKQTISLDAPMDRLDFSMDYTIGRNQKADYIVIIFYSLIGMVSTYSVFPGIVAVSLIQANLSNVAKRINATPLKKNQFLIAGVIVALILNMFSNGLLLVFIKYVLKLNLFNEFKYTPIFIILANLFGVSLGIFIGVSNRQSANVKTLIAIASTLGLSFFAGMMSPDIKILIDRNLPFINRINPISIVTDNIYKINLLGITEKINEGILLLSLYSIVLILISYVFIRRKTYDSI